MLFMFLILLVRHFYDLLLIVNLGIFYARSFLLPIKL